MEMNKYPFAAEFHQFHRSHMKANQQGMKNQNHQLNNHKEIIIEPQPIWFCLLDDIEFKSQLTYTDSYILLIGGTIYQHKHITFHKISANLYGWICNKSIISPNLIIFFILYQ